MGRRGGRWQRPGPTGGRHDGKTGRAVAACSVSGCWPLAASLEPPASRLGAPGSRLEPPGGLSRGRFVEGEGGWQSTKILAILSGDEPGEWWRRHGRARAGHMGPPISARAREQEGSRGGQQRRAAEEGGRGGHQRRAPEEGSRAAQAAGGSREGPVRDPSRSLSRGRKVEGEGGGRSTTICAIYSATTPVVGHG
jgi:hypothetical protein